MLLTLIILRLALSAVFGVAAITKFLDQDGAREAVKNFGAPPAFVRTIAMLLPAFELAIAIGLLFTSSTQVSAAAALGILMLFVVAIGYNLKQGRTHDCHCFGQLYSRPLGWPTLARNVVFALGAAFVLWQQPQAANTSLLDSLAGMRPWQWLIIIALGAGAIAAVFYGRQRNQREAVNPSHGSQGLPVGAIAPDFSLPDYEGGTTSLRSLLEPGKPLMLVFVSPMCGPCVLFFKEIGLWQKEHQAELTIAIISKGTIKENFVNVARNGLRAILLQEAQEVALAFQSHVTPNAVVIGADGRIASDMAAGSDEITKLLHATLGHEPRSARSAQTVNEAALVAQ
ncbi:MAG: hypothetical protein QOE77_27 [Blastocatellia bacterium]|jgi:uncharacterized membrane protein YphA (DoxX/SURF4 family)/peroxiredoxin|nr:hypothetical protein [Blastocatellia bacterium]